MGSYAGVVCVDKAVTVMNGYAVESGSVVGCNLSPAWYALRRPKEMHHPTPAAAERTPAGTVPAAALDFSKCDARHSFNDIVVLYFSCR